MTKDQQQQFLTALAMTGIVSDAAKAAGINRSTAYRYRAQYKSFAEDWDHAKDDATDRLAGVAIQRAVFFYCSGGAFRVRAPPHPLPHRGYPSALTFNRLTLTDTPQPTRNRKEIP